MLREREGQAVTFVDRFLDLGRNLLEYWIGNLRYEGLQGFDERNPSSQ